jgi:hypothetical protein
MNPTDAIVGLSRVGRFCARLIGTRLPDRPYKGRVVGVGLCVVPVDPTGPQSGRAR